MITTLNNTPAITGLANQRITFPARCDPRMARNNHTGVASNTSGGKKYDNAMCWNMCTEYKYSSLMSWMGQSLDSHNNAMTPVNIPAWRRVSTGSPARTSGLSGPMTRIAYNHAPTRNTTKTQTSGWARNRHGLTRVSAAIAAIWSLWCTVVSAQKEVEGS